MDYKNLWKIRLLLSLCTFLFWVLCPFYLNHCISMYDSYESLTGTFFTVWIEGFTPFIKPFVFLVPPYLVIPFVIVICSSFLMGFFSSLSTRKAVQAKKPIKGSTKLIAKVGLILPLIPFFGAFCTFSVSGSGDLAFMIVILIVLSILLLLMGIIFVLISRTAKLGVILIIISSILALMMPIFVVWFKSTPYYGFDFAIGLVILTPFILLQFFYTFEYSHFRAKDFQETSGLESA